MQASATVRDRAPAASVGCVLSAALCQLSRKNSIAGLLRDRAEQVAELAERVRANHVAIVLGEEQARLPFAGEHTEVILPEVDHHFVELTLARHGARELDADWSCPTSC